MDARKAERIAVAIQSGHTVAAIQYLRAEGILLPELYPSSDYTRDRKWYIKTGEFREPRAGEYYLSGAIPAVYTAPNDLSTKFHIMRKAAGN